MPPLPRADLVPQTPDHENLPLVKATGFREYDARWLFGTEINLLGVEALGLGLSGPQMHRIFRFVRAHARALVRHGQSYGHPAEGPLPKN